MKKIVLTQEEISDLKSIQEQNSQLIISFGQIEVATQNLEAQKLELKNQLQVLKNKENELAQSLQAKYGDGSINIETGEFTKVD